MKLVVATREMLESLQRDAAAFVEVGYEIAPEFRGRGYATEAARALIDKARAAGDVHTVRAHTLPSDNPSTSVLQHLDFRLVGEVSDDEQGTVWRWERAIT
jgi:RimJ/RimL family protein N-acetyltransferase